MPFRQPMQHPRRAVGHRRVGGRRVERAAEEDQERQPHKARRQPAAEPRPDLCVPVGRVPPRRASSPSALRPTKRRRPPRRRRPHSQPGSVGPGQTAATPPRLARTDTQIQILTSGRNDIYHEQLAGAGGPCKAAKLAPWGRCRWHLRHWNLLPRRTCAYLSRLSMTDPRYTKLAKTAGGVFHLLKAGRPRAAGHDRCAR